MLLHGWEERAANNAPADLSLPVCFAIGWSGLDWAGNVKSIGRISIFYYCAFTSSACLCAKTSVLADISATLQGEMGKNKKKKVGP